MITTARAMAHEFYTFVLRPRALVRARRADRTRYPSPWAVLAAMVATTVAMFVIYGQIFGSIVDNSRHARNPAAAEAGSRQRAPAAPADGPPHLAGLDIDPGFGIGMTVSDLEPTVMTVRGGVLTMAIAGVQPEGLIQGAFPFIMAGTFAALLAVSLYPPARLLGGGGGFAETFRLSALYAGYSIAGASALIVLPTVILIDVLGLRGAAYRTGWLLLSTIPVLTITVRSYFAMFAEHFGLPLWRLTIAAAAGLLVTVIAAPVVLFPAVYVAVRFQPILDVLF